MHLTDSELKIMNIIWDNNIIASGEIVKICFDRFNWKKSTTYTFLKRLEEKKAIVNNESIVSYLIDRELVQEVESNKLIDNSFNGSLPLFVASFLKNRKLSEKEYKEIKKIIEDNREE